MRGPLPKPASELAPGGNRRRQREKEVSAIEASPGTPDFPDWLPDQAVEEVKQVWDEITASLPPGVLATCDGLSLAHLCTAEVLMRRALRSLLADKSSGTFEAKSGLGVTKRRQRAPELITVERQGAIAHQLRQQFGLTPASRVRLGGAAAAGGTGNAAIQKLLKPSLRG